MACETQQSLGAMPNQSFVFRYYLEGDVSRSVLRLIFLLGICSTFALSAARGQNQGAPTQTQNSGGPSAASSTPAPPAPAPATQPNSAQPREIHPSPTQPAIEASPTEKALELLHADEFDEASSAYKAIIASGADPAVGYAGLARVYLRQHKIADAFTAAKGAVTISPKLPDAHVALGEVLYRQGKIDQAENEFLTVINSSAKNAQAFLDLARAESAASYHLQAKAMIGMAHRMAPDDPAVRSAWLSTLPREEQIKQLQAQLGGDGLDDKDRAAAAIRLAAFEEAEKLNAAECHLVNSVTSTQMNLEAMTGNATYLRAFGLKVKVNGTSAKLLLDTGASGITLNSKIAEKAGIKRLVDTRIGGVGDEGSMAGYIGIAETVRIGDLEFQNCAIRVTDRKSRLSEDGFIGGDVFSQFLLDLDFPNSKMRLSELPKIPQQPSAPLALEADQAGTSDSHDPYVAPEMKSFTRVYRIGHDLLIPTKLNGTPPRLFLVDSGSFDNTISTQAATEVTKLHLDSDVTVTGLSGKVNKVFTANDVIVDFAHFRQERHDLIAIDESSISDDAGVEISGTLGFQMLQILEIKIDYRDGLIDFKFTPNRFL